METLALTVGARHRFSKSFLPWSNGTVEAVGKAVPRGIHALRTDMQVHETEWSTTEQSIQLLIDNSPLRKLGGHAPITVHTGMVKGKPLSIVLTVAQVRSVHDLNEAGLIQKLNFAELSEALEEIRREVRVQPSSKQAISVDRRYRETHVIAYKHLLGDFVVVGCMRRPRTKMSLNWVSP